MSYDIFATLERLSARYRAEFHKFKLVDGRRVNWHGVPIDEAYAVVSDEHAIAIYRCLGQSRQGGVTNG